VFYTALWNRLRKPRPLLDSDRVSRFLKKKGYDRKTGQLTVAAFMPERETENSRLETSVFRTSTFKSETSVWRLGHLWTVVNPLWANSGTQPISGRADLIVSDVSAMEPLFLELMPSPHPEHANLLGWELEETGQQLQALLLVQKATWVPNLT
jgi:hypothetical protein